MSTPIPMAGRVSRSLSSKEAMAALLLIGFLLSAIHGHAASLDPGTVRINSATNHGSFCPTGAVDVEVSGGGKLLTLKFAQYKSSRFRNHCTVKLGLSYPAGLKFRLASVTMRGHAKLDDQASVRIRTSYQTFGDRFNGGPRSGTAACLIPGPLDGSFNCMDDFDEPLKEPVYGHCNGETELTIVTEPGLNGQAQIDLTQDFAIAWESC